MRYIAILVIFAVGSACGNPKVAPGVNIYISFERLAVVVGPTAAEFTGTFKFKTNGQKSYATQTIAVELPIWFPISSKADPKIAEFWTVFNQPNHNLFSPNERQMLKDVLHLKVQLAGRELQPNHLLISAGGNSTKSPEVLGCKSLLFYFPASPEEVGGENPIAISYRQPLLEYNGGRYFVYVPIFDNLPVGRLTSNTEFYSVSLTAGPTCDLRVKTATLTSPLRAGDEMTFAPQHLQSIRVLVNCRGIESLHSTLR